MELGARKSRFRSALCTTYSVKVIEFPSFLIFADCVERTVVTRLSIPEAVVVVRHNVYHIQVIHYGWEVVAFIND